MTAPRVAMGALAPGASQWDQAAAAAGSRQAAMACLLARSGITFNYQPTPS